MKKEISKKEALKRIDDFFKKSDFKTEEMRKIKRVAMKYRLSLKKYKKEFCKKCLSKLSGKIRVSKTHKSIECKFCKYKNKFRILLP